MDDSYVSLPGLRELFFIGNKFICERPVYWFRTNGDAAARIPSTVFVCPKCGDAWGRRVVVCSAPQHPEIADKLDWQADMELCPRHGGGSFLSAFEWEHALQIDDYYADHYPTPLLRYEAENLLRSSQ